MGVCGLISGPTNKVHLMPCSPCASGLPLNLLQLRIGEGDSERRALIGVIGMGVCGSISRPTNKVRLMPCSPCASGLPLNLLQLRIGEGDRERRALPSVARYGGSSCR
jgi:hypothetical protein